MSGGGELWDDALALPVASPLGEPLDPFDAEVVERLGLVPAPPSTPAEPGQVAAPLGAPPPFGGDGQADPSGEYGAPEISGEFVIAGDRAAVGDAMDTPPAVEATVSSPEGAVETPLGADVHLVVEPTPRQSAAFDASAPPAGVAPSPSVAPPAESPLEPPAPSPVEAPLEPPAPSPAEPPLEPPAPSPAEPPSEPPARSSVEAPLEPSAPSPARELAEAGPESLAPSPSSPEPTEDPASRAGESLAQPSSPVAPSPEPAESPSAAPEPAEGRTGAPLEPPSPVAPSPEPTEPVPDAPGPSGEPASPGAPPTPSVADAAAHEVVATGPSLFIPRLIRVVDEVGVPAAGDEGAEIEELEEVIEEVDLVEEREDAPAEPAPPAPQAAAPPPLAPPPQARRRRKHWADTVFGDAYPSLEPEGIGLVAERDAAYIVETAGIEPGATILDIGSGSGHLAVALAKLGFHVTGVDNSLPQVLRASERLAEAPDLEDRVAFMHGDMRALPTDEQFDLVTCIGTTFGYFEEDVNRQVLEHLYGHVRPGGRLVLQVINRDHLVSRLPVRSWWQGRGCMVLDEAEMNFFANRLRVHRTVAFEDGRQYEHYMFIRAYTLHDIGKLVSSTGLSVREVAGSRHTPGRFFGATSPDIWIFAERPAAGGDEG